MQDHTNLTRVNWAVNKLKEGCKSEGQIQAIDMLEKAFKDMRYEIKALRMSLISHGKIIEMNAELLDRIQKIQGCEPKIYSVNLNEAVMGQA